MVRNVFCGHCEKGALISQNLKRMNIEKEILPFLFGESIFTAVEKLIFLDACRAPSGRSYLSLSDSLPKVWRLGSGADGYFLSVRPHLITGLETVVTGALPPKL